MATKNMNNRRIRFTVSHVHEFENSGNVSFWLHVGRVTIYGMTLIRRNEGDFISFPSRKVKVNGEDKYYSHAYISLADDEQGEIIDAVEAALKDSDE